MKFWAQHGSMLCKLYETIPREKWITKEAMDKRDFTRFQFNAELLMLLQSLDIVVNTPNDILKL